jgi:hypothetical protein
MDEMEGEEKNTQKGRVFLPKILILNGIYRKFFVENLFFIRLFGSLLLFLKSFESLKSIPEEGFLHRKDPGMQ